MTWGGLRSRDPSCSLDEGGVLAVGKNLPEDVTIKDMTIQDVFNSNLARAGRALVGISTWHIANETGIKRKDIRKFERGIIDLPEDQKEAIQAVLIDHGALFLPDSQAGGYGVRLKYSQQKSKQLDRWEGEGGQPAEDNT